MDYSMQPWKTLSATVGAGVLNTGWNLDEVTNRSTARVFSLDVPFIEPFYNTPVVQAGLTGFDIDQDCSGRLSLKVSNITPNGFTVDVWTWEDTRVYAVEFSWLAIGA